MQLKLNHILKEDLDLWNNSADSVTSPLSPWEGSATAPTLVDQVTVKPESTTCKNTQRFTFDLSPLL